jgi:tetratricopeptide (TPR) repeat protein
MDITSLKRQGNLLFAQRDYAGAERTFREILAIDPVATEGLVGVAKVLSAQEREDEVIALLDPVVDQTQSVQLLKFLAIAYRVAVLRGAMSLAPRAIALNERYLQQRDDPVEWFYLGEIFDAVGDRERALTTYKRAWELQRDDPQVYNRVVAAAKRAGRLDEVVEAQKLWAERRKT